MFVFAKNDVGRGSQASFSRDALRNKVYRCWFLSDMAVVFRLIALTAGIIWMNMFQYLSIVGVNSSF
ncbi:hypothetical protein BCU70_09610 [Vibrio sp. 10N.286.49.C2]|uniref:hypothetical protein n=1 Tax=Vibrio sp. 10N.286.49.B1 TaxID=1880854 RepID=UPI000C856524|nr:hypothetical protein BCU70_09610 [Vibrio sp. 10N.286.49.C2]PMH54872.1 hypothetical protein BCU66_11325 [Vibrio sp. 10N.286.49.B1]PMH84110.1 hypothetical protein BCU58_00180 [Vibrio sp. 10N.286.48.B7]